jgi:hypothetical protein
MNPQSIYFLWNCGRALRHESIETRPAVYMAKGNRVVISHYEEQSRSMLAGPEGYGVLGNRSL